MRWVAVALLVATSSCAVLQPDRTKPVGCRERTAARLAALYPEPEALAAVIDNVCGAETP